MLSQRISEEEEEQEEEATIDFVSYLFQILPGFLLFLSQLISQEVIFVQSLFQSDNFLYTPRVALAC